MDNASGMKYTLTALYNLGVQRSVIMVARTTQSKLWTFMVYMAGDNNLDPNGVTDLKEMKKTGSTDDVNVIAQFDRTSGKGSKRYFLRKGGTVDADAVATLGKVNTGDPKRLIQVGRKNVPCQSLHRRAVEPWPGLGRHRHLCRRAGPRGASTG
jgi:hypothetical protein